MSVQELTIENDYELFITSPQLIASVIDAKPGNPLFIGNTNISNMIIGNTAAPLVLRGLSLNIVTDVINLSGLEHVLPFSFSGAYILPIAGNILIRKLGTWVDIMIKPSSLFTVSNSGSALISNSVIPIGYRPLSTQYVSCIISNNANIESGGLFINSDGTFTVNRLAGPWTNGSQAGLLTCSNSYSIA